MAKIEHPKIFISYAWTDEDYTKKVTEFVNRLLGDGIEVIFDKFDMKPGNEMTDFMEKSVKDPSVTSVLLLLNPHYKEKADCRTGGVGTETQIISPEVYNNVENTKFIPVIFDKNNKELVDCLPIFLKSRYSIDLTDPATKEEHYIFLIRTLFGVATERKAPLGSEPAWVEKSDAISSQVIELISNVKGSINEEQAKENGIIGFESILMILKKVDLSGLSSDISSDKKIEIFKRLIPVRNTYLDFLASISYQNGIDDSIVDFFESVDEYAASLPSDSLSKNAIHAFMHECVIYTIGLLFKRHHYLEISSVIFRPYFSHEPFFNQGKTFDDMFYCLRDQSSDEMFTDYYLKTTGKRKFSGFAQYLIDNIYIQVLSKDEFIDSDILCANLTSSQKGGQPWFALTYVYNHFSESSPILEKIAYSLRSKILAPKFYPLFGRTDQKDMQNAISDIAAKFQGFSHFGYNNSFDTIPSLADIIKPEDICSKN
jgi:hypothetical protein